MQHFPHIGTILQHKLRGTEMAINAVLWAHMGQEGV